MNLVKTPTSLGKYGITSLLLIFERKEKMKLIYETPEIDLIILDIADIITTSGENNNNIDEDLGENDGEWM